MACSASIAKGAREQRAALAGRLVPDRMRALESTWQVTNVRNKEQLLAFIRQRVGSTEVSARCPPLPQPPLQLIWMG